MKALFGKLSVVLLANITNTLTKLMIVILITKILGSRQLGEYTLALAITAPLSLLFNMKLRAYLVSSDNINFYISSKFRTLTSILSLIICEIIALIFYKDLFLIITLVMILKVLDINSEFYQAFPNKLKKFKESSILLIIKSIISLLLFTLVITYTENLYFSLIIQIIFTFIFQFFERNYLYKAGNAFSYKNNVSFKNLFISLLPLGIVQAIYTYSANIPKFALEKFYSIELVGILSALLYIITIVNLLMNTISQTFLPYMKKLYKNDKKKFNKYLHIYLNLIALAIGLIFLILNSILGESILQILFNNKISEFKNVLLIMTIVIPSSISSWIYDSALLLKGSVKFQPLFLIISSLITYILSLILIPPYGVYGAAYVLGVFHLLNLVFKIAYYTIPSSRSE
ncbi:oligosaccharide flippase family protein [Macrococcus bovicus]|uniref:Capsular biosynthesis protein n=1 Tax=Macrococcus bovicus TaxID=69968 RepID=A0A4R6C128_9STAP|nr:oligosaccharide flippase family protein [Macrococcus bovicus]TDM14915.1 capsular biosynthesis protein [Macrococcus bovicus]